MAIGGRIQDWEAEGFLADFMPAEKSGDWPQQTISDNISIKKFDVAATVGAIAKRMTGKSSSYFRA